MSKEEVFIQAASNSRRFDKIVETMDGSDMSARNITGYDIVATIDGEERSQSLGEYNKQRFPNSRQGIRPRFSISENRFLIKRADGTFWNQSDLNKAVQEIVLTYPDTHPKKGEIITSANIHDDADPFINHPSFVRVLFEGEDTLNPQSPKDKFQEDALRGNPSFMDEAVDGVRSSEVEFIIRNPSISEEREEQERENSELAWDYYTAMKTNPDRMRKILALFGVDMEESATTKNIRNTLHKKVIDNVTRERGSTLQKLFITFAEYEDTETNPDLSLRATIALASLRKIIWDRAGVYEFEGSPIANTFEGVLDYMKKPENHAAYEAIKIRLNSK